MAIAQNNTITKSDVVNLFNTNIKNVINSGVYHSGSHLTYATTPAGTEALPTDQYGEVAGDFSISDTTITASTLYTALVNLVKDYTRVRLVTSSSYFFSETTYTGYTPSYTSSDTIQETLSGKKVAFAATVPSVSGSTRPYYTKSPNDTTMTKDISPVNPGITINTTALASHITTFISNLKSSWDSIYNNNQITFEYHYCHSNWSSWTSRARR